MHSVSIAIRVANSIDLPVPIPVDCPIEISIDIGNPVAVQTMLDRRGGVTDVFRIAVGISISVETV